MTAKSPRPDDVELDEILDQIPEINIIFELKDDIKSQLSKLIQTRVLEANRLAVANWWKGRTVPYKTIRGKDYVPLTWVEEQTRFMDELGGVAELPPNTDTSSVRGKG